MCPIESGNPIVDIDTLFYVWPLTPCDFAVGQLFTTCYHYYLAGYIDSGTYRFSDGSTSFCDMTNPAKSMYRYDGNFTHIINNPGLKLDYVPPYINSYHWNNTCLWSHVTHFSREDNSLVIPVSQLLGVLWPIAAIAHSAARAGLIVYSYIAYYTIIIVTVESDLIATEMLAFPSKSSRNKNDSDPINGKTTLI